jgi:hypothetical protein
LIGFLLSFTGVSGIAGMLNQLNAVLPPEDQIEMGGMEATLVNLVGTTIGVLFDVIVGAIAGYIGALLFRDKVQPQI